LYELLLLQFAVLGVIFHTHGRKCKEIWRYFSFAENETSCTHVSVDE